MECANTKLHRQTFIVYILRCSDGSFYVGHTHDINERVQVHNNGLRAAWTAARRPVVLLYQEHYPTEAEAVARERQLKGWSSRKKLALIENDTRTLKALATRRVR